MSGKIKEKELNYQMIYQDLVSQKLNSVEDYLREHLSNIINKALDEELSDFLGREPYERKRHIPEEFRGYRNGYQDYTVKSRFGKMPLKKPRIRNHTEKYVSKILERIDTLEENLHRLVIESYARGLSTRDIEKTFIDDEGNAMISKSGASEISKQLYDEYEEFSKRDLSKYDVVYLFVDGVFEAVRRYTNKQALLCAWGITSSGEKVLLSMSVADTESSDSWIAFFEDMKNRGLGQPLLVISDGGKGLLKGITNSFPMSERQRCIAHKLRNISSKVPEERKDDVLKQVRAVYYAPDKASAELLAQNFIANWTNTFPTMVNCFTDDLDSCIKHLGYPAGHHKYIRTTNAIERTFVEQKRRTKTIPKHQNEKGMLGLVFGVLNRAAKDWRKIKMSDLDLTILKNLKIMRCKSKGIDLQNERISMSA